MGLTISRSSHPSHQTRYLRHLLPPGASGGRQTAPTSALPASFAILSLRDVADPLNSGSAPARGTGEVIPDGMGGLLAWWSDDYQVQAGPSWWDAMREARLTRVTDSGLTEYPLPTPDWWTWWYAPRDRSLVLGEDGVAFGTFGGRVVSFDVATGAVRWTWEAPSGQLEMIAATAGNGLVLKVPAEGGEEGIARLDANGQATYENWTGNSVQYAYGNTWLSRGSAEDVSATGISWASSPFAAAGQHGSSSSFRHFELDLFFCAAQKCGAYPDVEFIYQATPQSPIINLNDGQILTVRTEAFKALKTAFAGYPAKVVYATPTNNQAWVNGEDRNLCGEQSQDGTTGYIYYLTHMSGARWVVNPDFTVPTPENAAEFQRIIEAIGRGIGITSAHEFGHQFGIGGEYLESRGVYEGGVCSPTEDPSGWTGIGPDGTPIHWGEEAAGIIKRKIFGD
jgi:hypothetical protein